MAVNNLVIYFMYNVYIHVTHVLLCYNYFVYLAIKLVSYLPYFVIHKISSHAFCILGQWFFLLSHVQEHKTTNLRLHKFIRKMNHISQGSYVCFNRASIIFFRQITFSLGKNYLLPKILIFLYWRVQFLNYSESLKLCIWLFKKHYFLKTLCQC